MLKVKNDLCPEIIKSLFHLSTDQNPRKYFFVPIARTEYRGKQSLTYFGPLVWDCLLPKDQHPAFRKSWFHALRQNFFADVSIFGDDVIIWEYIGK